MAHQEHFFQNYQKWLCCCFSLLVWVESTQNPGLPGTAPLFWFLGKNFVPILPKRPPRGAIPRYNRRRVLLYFVILLFWFLGKNFCQFCSRGRHAVPYHGTIGAVSCCGTIVVQCHSNNRCCAFWYNCGSIPLRYICGCAVLCGTIAIQYHWKTRPAPHSTPLPNVLLCIISCLGSLARALIEHSKKKWKALEATDRRPLEQAPKSSGFQFRLG